MFIMWKKKMGCGDGAFVAQMGGGSYETVSYCFLGDMLIKEHWSSGEYPFLSSHEHGSGHSGKPSMNIHTNVWGSNVIDLLKIKYMTSCIPTHILLTYSVILWYWLGFGLYTPQAWPGPHECKNTASRWLALEFSSSWKSQLWLLFQ